MPNNGSTDAPKGTGGIRHVVGTPPRPRSLCDSKLLSVSPTPRGFHGHHHQQQENVHSNSRNGKTPPSQVPRRPPPDPPRPRSFAPDASKYRGSWPNVHYNGTNSTDSGDHHLVALEQQYKAPSMAALMNTTVPQRLTRPGLMRGGQHTPTRNSLRHSRMICLSQQGKVPRKYLPPVIHHYRTGCGLVVAQLLLGIALLGLALRLIFWSPQLNTRDIPHWSGTALMLSGVFGMFLLCCCRKQYPGMRGGCCVFVVRIQYIVCNACLAMAATAACVCACIFASVHVSHLSTMICQSSPDNSTVAGEEPSFNSTCLCADGNHNETYYTYDPLSCHEVLQLLPIYLSTSAVINALACLVTSWYVILLWSNRFAYTYAGLKVPERKASAISAMYN